MADCFVDYIKVVEKYGTPLYFIDSSKAKERINNIKEILPKNTRLCYAIKANAFLVNELKNEDLMFEVCSPGELSICEEKQLLPKKIVFSGVCKTLEDIKRAYNLKVNTITLESLLHCEYLIKTVKSEKEHTQDVIIRLSNGNQFGMSKEDVYECVKLLKPYSNINIRGIHFFTGTQKKIKKLQKKLLLLKIFATNCNLIQESFFQA